MMMELCVSKLKQTLSRYVVSNTQGAWDFSSHFDAKRDRHNYVDSHSKKRVMRELRLRVAPLLRVVCADGI